MFDGGKVKKIEMGEYVFGIRQFAPFHAMHVLGELQKIILPAIGGALGGIKNQGTNMDVDIKGIAVIGSALGDAVNNLASKLDGEQIERAMRILLDPDYVSVSKKGEKDFQRLDEDMTNEIFCGRPIDMVALAVHVFRVNYMDFSKLCSIPSGWMDTLAEMKTAFLAKLSPSSGSEPSSTEQ